MKDLVVPLLAVGAGACLAVQAAANSKLRRLLDTPDAPLVAAFYSICGTILTAGAAMLLLRPAWPSWESMRGTHWWNWIGGPTGALIVLAGASLVKDLGAAAFISLVIGGQLLGSLVFDHFALMGLEAQPLTWGRVLGAILVVVGVICIKTL